VIGQLAVEVGAHGDQHRRAQREQAVDERMAATAVVAQRVELLELVDDELAGVVGHVELRRAARDHDRRAVELLDLAREHRRHDAGAHDGGLAAARRADDGEQPPRLEPTDDIGDDVLAPEEERAVGGLEGQKAAVRALAGRQRVGQPGAAQRADPLQGSDAAQPVGPEVDEVVSLRRDDELRGGR
jgi:hypothetical protein